MVAPTENNPLHCRGEEIACNLVVACLLPLGRPPRRKSIQTKPLFVILVVYFLILLQKYFFFAFLFTSF